MPGKGPPLDRILAWHDERKNKLTRIETYAAKRIDEIFLSLTAQCMLAQKDLRKEIEALIPGLELKSYVVERRML